MNPNQKQISFLELTRYLQLINEEYGSNVKGINSEDNHNWLKLRKRLFNQANLLKRFISNTPINQENISFLEKLKFLKAGLDLKYSI